MYSDRETHSQVNAVLGNNHHLIQHFNSIFLDSQDIVNLFSLSKNEIIAINPAATRELGYNQADLASVPIFKLYPQDEIARVEEAFSNLKEKGYVQLRTKAFAKSGELRHFWIRSFVVQREPEWVALVHTVDVTDEKRRGLKVMQGTKDFLASLKLVNRYEKELSTYYESPETKAREEEEFFPINTDFLTMRGTNNQEISLTPTEMKILSIFKQSQGCVANRERIIKRIWGLSPMGNNTFNVHLSRLRKKLTSTGYEIVKLAGEQYHLKKS